MHEDYGLPELRARMKFELNPHNRNTPDEVLIADVKRVAGELNRESVTLDEYNERGQFNASTLKRRFGSWFTVLELAGLQRSRSPLNISEEELFLNLEEVWSRLGRQPKYAEIMKPLSKYSAGTYEHRFGTWRKALEQFVLDINREERVSSEDQIRQLEIVPSSRHRTKRSINWRLRFLVLRNDDFKCRSCGRSPATDSSVILHVDHKIAWANGGETVIENLQTLCSICNIGKSDVE